MPCLRSFPLTRSLSVLSGCSLTHSLSVDLLSRYSLALALSLSRSPSLSAFLSVSVFVRGCVCPCVCWGEGLVLVHGGANCWEDKKTTTEERVREREVSVVGCKKNIACLW